MRIARFLLMFANLAAPIGWLLSGFSLWAGGVMFVIHMLTLWATFWPSCRWWGEVTCEFRTDSPEVWLTIDDGPDGGNTRTVLDLLEERGAKATFFFVGEACRKYPELPAEVMRRGHGLANHTQNHPAHAFWAMGPRRVFRELSECSETIKELSGGRPVLFRAPAGFRNCFVHPALGKLGMKLVGWSARGFDGSRQDVDRILSRIGKRIRPGAVILLHEGRTSDDGQPLIYKTLPRILDLIESRGLKCVIPDVS